MNDSYDRELAENFLTFMLDYYAMIRRHIVEKNEIRFHSHGFYLLNILESNKDELLTMSACAKQMNITWKGRAMLSAHTTRTTDGR